MLLLDDQIIQVSVGIAHRIQNDKFNVILINRTSYIWPGNIIHIINNASVYFWLAFLLELVYSLEIKLHLPIHFKKLDFLIITGL